MFQLFDIKIKIITLCMWTMWFCICFMKFGIYQIVPFIMGKEKATFYTMSIAICGEIPALLTSLYLLDK